MTNPKQRIEAALPEVPSKLRLRAERRVGDTRFDPLRRPWPRRVLALSVLAAALASAWGHSGSLPGGGISSFLLVLWILCGILVLRVVVNRTWLDFPDELVAELADEHIRDALDGVRSTCYLCLFLLCSMSSLIAFLIYPDGRTIDLGLQPYGHFAALFWTAFVLPDVVFALKVRKL